MNRTKRFALLVLFVTSGVHAQIAVESADPAARPNHTDVITFYALGDWGTGYITQEPVAAALERNVARLPKNRHVTPFALELGDNIYPSGLPYHPSLTALINAWNDPEAFNLLENTFGQVYRYVRYNDQPIIFHVIPGNHDYGGLSEAKKKDTGDVLLQETLAEHLYPGWWRYYPIDHKKAGVKDTDDFREYAGLRKYVEENGIRSLTLPEKLSLPKQPIVDIFAIDTQIILELYEENDETITQQHWQRLEDLLSASTATWKIIIGHHPIASWGVHGGYSKGLKGFVRYKIGYMQDLEDGDYRKFRDRLAAIMKQHDVSLYFSGHEHNLQFMPLDAKNAERLDLNASFFQVISGSAGKLSEIADDHQALLAYDKQHGFARIDVVNNDLWVEFLTYDAETGNDQSLGLWKLSKQ